jgi:small-conductance mechanosensitive channel
MTSLSGGIQQFNVRAWTLDGADWLVVRSRLAMNVRQALTDAGIEVPRPQAEVHLGGAAVASAAVEPRPLPAALARTRRDETPPAQSSGAGRAR